MRGSKGSRLAAGALVSVVAATLPLLGAGTANARTEAAEVVYYDASEAAGWSANVTQAVANWNSEEHNVQLVAATPAKATVHLVDDPGWPETTTGSPGSGTVHLGEEAVDEGYDKTRITAHELGHILGLPDNYNGDCTLLMSGHSAGTACTTAAPSPSEATEVDEIFSKPSSTATAGHQQPALTKTVF